MLDAKRFMSKIMSSEVFQVIHQYFTLIKKNVFKELPNGEGRTKQVPTLGANGF